MVKEGKKEELEVFLKGDGNDKLVDVFHVSYFFLLLLLLFFVLYFL